MLQPLLIVVLAFAQTGEPTLFLDLTTAEVQAMDRSKTVGCHSGGGVMTSGVPFRRPQLTLRLSIDHLNGNTFKRGDVLIADVLLTNTGDKPVLLPWDPDSDIVYGKDCKGLPTPRPPTLEGSLALKLLDHEGQGPFVGGHFLYARRDEAPTCRVLAPQQSARLRVGGMFYPTAARTGGSLAPGANTFRLVAIFSLTDSALPNAYEPVVSANHQNLALTEK